ncbi:hypothetical protein SAMN05444817_11550 [Corynebacterium appendicis CIP 107643]|uniref:Uncharacterized protein n=1 Tax=Corynebacterium appendicis CIP 107643 TaxID=1161099 RepID=A0A1N7K8V5_9CORY|nr:hypothetical protein [Corynebacterium appendicis]WJY61734.1 hypothetical protein CAPP_09155 [Corynebacterium appendicis CIP 107643]SIS57894.1 hypothetical protein SAMN05444817_11550 [Corynebacterium appendicis CIP 107643]
MTQPDNNTGNAGSEKGKLLDAATRRIGNEPDTDPISDLDRLESRDLDRLDEEEIGEDDSSFANDNPDGPSELT